MSRQNVIQKNNSRTIRFSFIVPNKIIPRAVDRNRLRRILSETVNRRMRTMDNIVGFNIIIILNKKDTEDKIISDLVSLLARLENYYE